MTEKRIDKAIRAIRKNYSFGAAVIFDGRCIAVFPEENKTFKLSSGCYTTLANLPEFEAMKTAGTVEFTEVDMGGGLVKARAIMTEEQLTKYLAAADDADWEP